MPTSDGGDAGADETPNPNPSAGKHAPQLKKSKTITAADGAVATVGANLQRSSPLAAVRRSSTSPLNLTVAVDDPSDAPSTAAGGGVLDRDWCYPSFLGPYPSRPRPPPQHKKKQPDPLPIPTRRGLAFQKPPDRALRGKPLRSFEEGEKKETKGGISLDERKPALVSSPVPRSPACKSRGLSVSLVFFTVCVKDPNFFLIFPLISSSLATSQICLHLYVIYCVVRYKP